MDARAIAKNTQNQKAVIQAHPRIRWTWMRIQPLSAALVCASSPCATLVCASRKPLATTAKKKTFNNMPDQSFGPANPIRRISIAMYETVRYVYLPSRYTTENTSESATVGEPHSMLSWGKPEDSDNPSRVAPEDRALPLEKLVHHAAGRSYYNRTPSELGRAKKPRVGEQLTERKQAQSYTEPTTLRPINRALNSRGRNPHTMWSDHHDPRHLSLNKPGISQEWYRPRGRGIDLRSTGISQACTRRQMCRYKRR